MTWGWKEDADQAELDALVERLRVEPNVLPHVRMTKDAAKALADAVAEHDRFVGREITLEEWRDQTTAHVDTDGHLYVIHEQVGFIFQIDAPSWRYVAEA